MRAKHQRDQTEEQHDQKDKRDYSPEAEVCRVICKESDLVILPQARNSSIVIEVKKEMPGIPALFADIIISTESGLVKISTEAPRAEGAALSLVKDMRNRPNQVFPVRSRT